VKVIVDTNVVLDVLLARKPFAGSAARIFSLAEKSEISGMLCATTLTTVDYLLSQALPKEDARQILWKLISLFEVAPVNRLVIERALHSRIHDFEDAVLDEAGRLAGAECIITRNTKDFSHSSLRVLDAAEFLSQMEA
jgi:predicted nucleic acid-binding protein